MTGESTFGNLHEVLRSLYDKDDAALLGHHRRDQVSGIGRVVLLGLTGMAGALRAPEPIDDVSLFRPFCIGACIMFFPPSCWEPSAS